MKVKVLRTFSDKFHLTRSYMPGEVVDFEDSRALNIVERGLGEPYAEPKPKAEPKVEPKVEKPVVKAEKEAPVAEPLPEMETETTVVVEEKVSDGVAAVEDAPAAEDKPKRGRKKKTE